MNLFISNGLIVDPALGDPALGDLVVEEGIIKEIRIHGREKSERMEEAEKVGASAPESWTPAENVHIHGERIHIDAAGKWIVPGLIDLHVHLREPGFEYKEDVASGCRSAAKGGVTTVCCMPNTDPVIDCPYVVLMVASRAKEGNGVQVLCIGAVTKGQEGRELADYEGMLRTGSSSSRLTGGGICGISEDGKTVQDRELMLTAMRKAKELGLTVFSHAEPEAEIVKRDLELAELSGCRLHFCHISEKESVELIRQAKKRGLSVTAETAPHYFTLCRDDVGGDANRKMNPPLGRRDDMEAVKQALKDGTLDAIATDHAPHHPREKALPYQEAPNGVIGLETSFAVSYSGLVRTGVLTPLELVKKMSAGPAEILGIDRGSLRPGMPADLAVIDVEAEYEIDPETFASKGKNSPFIGRKVYGRVEYTVAGGKVIWGGAPESHALRGGSSESRAASEGQEVSR